jgi:hypothetical protein
MIVSGAETLLALAERCESADRELDFLIAEAISDDKDHWLGCRVRQERWYEMSDYKAGDPTPVRWEWSQPAFTASLDAAMTLIDPRALWATGSMEDGPFARLCWPMPGGTFVGGYIEATAATVPLAICAAALRARARAQEPDHG